MPDPTRPSRVRLVAIAVLGLLWLAAPWLGRTTAEATTSDAGVAAPVQGAQGPPVDPEAARQEMTPAKAAVLGLVEGVTEYLPVSSTGHLLVAQRAMDIGTEDGTKDAADSYAIAIQAGAILAVLLLYHARIRTLLAGLVGRDEQGRRVLTGLVLAFVPAAVVGLALESTIKDVLLGAWPVVVAWVVGGVAILTLGVRLERRTDGTALEAMVPRQALIIGLAQCLALWPGTSRSLVTILAALAVGLSVAAAVEFSFLLGLATLGAATAYETLRNGGAMVDAYGVVDPLIGLVVAFVSAAVAIRWMVGYLQRHSLAIFGWYQLGVGAVVAVLLITGAI